MNKELKTAEEILRGIFNETTGRSCDDEQWQEYLLKDSIQLTISAMESYAEQFKLPPITKEQAEKIWDRACDIKVSDETWLMSKETFIEVLTSINK